MAEFNSDAYFKARFGALGDIKAKSIQNVMADKLAKLGAYQQAAANGNAYMEPKRDLADIAGDAGVVAVSGAIGLPQSVVGLADIVSGGQAGKSLEEMGYRPGDAKAIMGDLYSDAQKEANLRVERADGFGNTLEAALENPSVIATTVGEAIPQMLGGAAVARGVLGLGARAVGSAAGGVGPALPGVAARVMGEKAASVAAAAAGEGLLGAGSAAEQIRNETADGLLTGKQALSAVGTGVVTGVFGAAGARLAQKMGVPDIDTLLASGKGVSKAGFVKAALGSGITEGVFEEMPQSAQEQMWQNYALDKPLLEGVGDASAMGLLSGMAMGGIGGGGGALSGSEKQKEEKKAETKLTQEEAIKTGDVSALADPKSKDYDPEKAVAALVGNSQLDTTDTAGKQANLEKGQAIVDGLDERRQALTDLLVTSEQKQADIAALKQRLAAVDPADTARVAAFTQAIADSEADLAEPQLTAEETATYRRQLEKVNTQLTGARRAMKDLDVAAQVADSVEEQVALIKSPLTVTGDTEVDAAASTKQQDAVRIVLAMATTAPERLSPEVAAELAADENNALTAPQRGLLRAFSEARIAANAVRDLKAVKNEVLEGSDENLGIKQYRANIATAVSRGDRKRARKFMSMLEDFADQRTNKAEAANAAFRQGMGTQIVVTDGVFGINKGKRLDRVALKKNGGLDVNSGSLVQTIELEAKAVVAAVAEMRALMGVSPVAPETKTTKTNGASDVENAPQQGTGTQGESQAGAVPSAGTDGVAAAPVDTGPAPVTGGTADVVEAPGVTATQAEYDEAVRVKNSTNEADYDNVPEKIGRLVTALNNEEEIKIIQSTEGDSVSSGDVQQTQVAENTQTTESSLSSEENQSTEDTTTQTEEAETPVTAGDEGVEATTQEVSKEVLSVFTKKSPEGTAYVDRNLVADFFVQVKNKALGSTRDFLTAWTQGAVDVHKQVGLSSNAETASIQRGALNDLQMRLTKWNKTLKANLVLDTKTLPEFKNRDMLQFLLSQTEGGVTTDENVLTAMSYAGYQWALTQAQGGVKTKEQVLSMHGKDKEAFISHEGYATLGTMVGFHDRVINDLGRVAVQALGLKPTKNAPQDLLPKLEMAMGTHIMAMLVKEQVLTRNHIAREDLSRFFDDGGEMDKDTDVEAADSSEFEGVEAVTYIGLVRKPVTDGSWGPLGSVPAGIKSANAGSYDVVNTVFDAGLPTRFAGTKPVKFVQKFAKRTKQTISKMQRAVVARTMATPHKVILEMLALTEVMGKQAFLKMAGWVEIDASKHHESEHKGIVAQNENLERQYDLMMEMLNNPDNPDGVLSEFFVEQEVWSNFRAGFLNASLNQQTSKIHRYMFARPSWTANLDFKNKVLMDNFLVSVAQAVGVKVDKQLNAKTLELLDMEMAEGTSMRAAVNALRRTIDTLESLELTEQESDLIASVAAGAEGMMTMQALVAFAKYENAVARGDESVQVTMLVGADGKTSGPMLTHLALGVGETEEGLYEVLQRGGMYSTDEGAPKHYSDYAARPKSKDLYESLMAAVMGKASELMAPLRQIIALHRAKDKRAFKLFTEEQWKSMLVLTKPLMNELTGDVTSDGRGLVKTPLTAFGFGSSLRSAVNSMENKFIDTLYGLISDMAQGKKKAPTREAYLDAVNALIKLGNHKETGLDNLNMEQLLKLKFTKSQEKALRAAFRRVMGEPVRNAFQQEFAVFVKRRQQLNKTIQASFGTYQTVYTQAREAEIARLVESGEIAPRVDKKGNKVALHDMTVEQEEAFREQYADILPVMHTDYSLTESDSNGGLYMAKRKQAPNKDSLYSTKTSLATGWTNKLGKMTFQPETEPITQQEEAPGVAGSAWSIHSLDSAAIHKGMRDVPESMNVHDEIGTGVHLISQAAQAINEGVMESLLNYSPAREALRTFERLTIAVAARVKAGTLSPAAVPAVIQSWADAFNDRLPDELKISLGMAIDAMPAMAFNNAKAADTLRLGVIAKMAVMDQYPWEGGSFQVTDEIRTLAQTRLDNLPTEMSPELKEALGILLPVFEQEKPAWERKQAELRAKKQAEAEKKKKAATTKVAQPAGEADLVEAPAPKTSPFGKIGKPTLASDKGMVAFFEANPETTAGRVIAGLVRRYENDSALPNRQFNLKLLKALTKLVNPNLPIKYVTPATDLSEVLGDPEVNARGWFSIFGADEAIYVLGTDFVASGVTPEVLLHELVHAAVTRTTANQAAATKELLAELGNLLTLAKHKVADMPLEKRQQFAPALSSVHELIAWGMTNKTFQTEVLEQIEMQSVNKEHGLVSGMKAFIESITKFLFRSSSEENSTGLDVLITNVSGLFAQAAQEKAEKPANEEVVMTLAMEAVIDEVQSYTTQELLHALDDGSVSPSFQNQLQGLLGGIVDALHGPFGSFKEAMKRDQASSPMDVWLKALDTGKAPFGKKVLDSMFVQSDQEAFAIEQVEATMEAALEANEALTTMAYRELYNLFTAAQKQLSAKDFHDGDWAQASPDAKRIAQDKYDFVFKVPGTSMAKNNYLARFAALGLASESFNKLLQFSTAAETKAAPKTLADKLQALFERVLQFWQEKVTHTYEGQPANDKLEALVGQLVDIEAKRRRMVTKNELQKQFMAPIEDGVKSAFEAVRKKAVKLSQSPVLAESKSGFVRGGAAIAGIIGNDRVEAFMDALSNLRDREQAGRPGVLAGILNDVRGAPARLQALTRAKTDHDRRRKAVMNNASTVALSMFANGGKGMSKPVKAALTQVFLRTGAHALLANMNGQQLFDTLSSSALTQKTIEGLEARLNNFPQFKGYFIEQSNVLAYNKATGRTKGALLMQNTHNIARMYGTRHAGKLTDQAVAEVSEVLDQLVALYAIQYLDRSVVNKALTVLASENQRTDENGVVSLLNLHRRLEQESAERLFNGNRTQMVHGYTPEIYNQHVGVVVANAEEGKALLDQGYTLVAKVARDPSDPDTDAKGLYKLMDGGTPPFLAGAISMTGLHAKGSPAHSGFMNTLNASNQVAITQHPERKADVEAMFKSTGRRDLSKAPGTFMSPMLDDRGNVMNWRYTMAEDTKDSVLDRDNRFEKILGVLAGATYDKVSSPEQNRNVLQTLKELHLEQASRNPESYIEVGPESDDPEMREIWAMLPEQTKADVKKIWGTTYLMVRKDSLDLVFGYHKLSLANAFRKDPEFRNHAENITVTVIEGILRLVARSKGMDTERAEQYAKRAAALVTKSERMWQELVKEAKDIIVVKSGVVMLGNIWSNLWLLGLSGVPMKDIAHHHLVAMKGATTYLADSEELGRLRTLRSIGHTQAGSEDIDSRIFRLEDALKRNPVAELIDAGLMPSIVEDVALDDDPYSYKSALSRKAEALTSKLHPKVVEMARVTYMTHDTKLYKALSRVTQLSDFVARYTYYQHLISRQDKPMDKISAIHEASEAFVNYDTPMHRMVQYTDDMGITLFTKYFLRIQRVLLKLAKDHPARVLGTVLLSNFMDLGPIVLEGSVVFKFGDNPIQSGPLTLLNVLDELATVSAGAALIK